MHSHTNISLSFKKSHFSENFKILRCTGQTSDYRNLLVQEQASQETFFAKEFDLNQFTNLQLSRKLGQLRASRLLSDPAFVGYRGALICEDKLIVVKELQQHSLTDLVAALFPQGVPHWPLSSQILKTLALGFTRFHAAKLLVTNLDPHQVFVDRHCRVRLDLFKYSQRLKDLRRNSLIIGNTCMLAPEFFGEQERFQPGLKSDSYLFGALAVFLLSGKVPYADCTLFECMSRKQEEDFVLDPEIAKRVDKKFFALLQGCLLLDPTERTPLSEILAFFKKVSLAK